MGEDGVEPTELAGIADAETEFAQAWSLDNVGEIEGPPRRFTASQITAAAVVTSLLITIGVTAFGVYSMSRDQSAPVTPVRVVIPPQGPALDGTYRLTYKPSAQTQNGVSNPADPDPAADTTYWAFRTECSDDRACAAAGVALDPADFKSIRTPPADATLHLVDGRWQQLPATVEQAEQRLCLLEDGDIGVGKHTEHVAWSLEPLAESLMRGVMTSTVITNECGFQGTVNELPVDLARIGAVPADIHIDVPAPTQELTFPEASRATAGTNLDGLYRFTFDNSHQLVNGRQVTSPLPNTTEMWAFKSACSRERCAATAAQVFDENVHQNTGVVTVLHFSKGEWTQSIPTLQVPSPCRNGVDSDIIGLGWSVAEQPDKTLRGTAIGTILTDGCGLKGNVYKTPMSAVRTSDTPPSVVLADPLSFTESA